MGKDALPALMEALKEKNNNVRVNVIYALQQMNVDAKTVKPLLLPLLKEEEAGVRQAAVQGLGRFRAEVLDDLLGLVDDKDAGVRWLTAQYIGNCGKQAKKAIPALEKMAAKDTDGTVRYYAVTALASVGNDAIPSLIELARVKDYDQRYMVLNYLAGFGAASKDAVPVLREALKDKDPQIRWRAAYALGQIGPGAKDALKDLEEAVKDKDQNVQIYAKQAIQIIKRKQ
jgi:HEAT repeat protein